jgi:predicted ATPase
VTLATEQGFPSFVAAGTLLRGIALAAQGRVAEGLAQLREGFTAWRATGAEVMTTWALTALAEALGQAGQGEDGLAAVAEGLAFAQDKGEHFSEAELHRLRGELLLQPRPRRSQVEAEAPVSPGPAVPAGNGRSPGVAAVMSLTRLYQQQGRPASPTAATGPWLF